MNDEEVTRKLQSVGMTAFVDHFSVFEQYAAGKLSKQKCIDYLVSNGVSNAAGAAIRCGNGKAIFLAGRQRDALARIASSNRMPSDVVERARSIASALDSS